MRVTAMRISLILFMMLIAVLALFTDLKQPRSQSLDSQISKFDVFGMLAMSALIGLGVIAGFIDRNANLEDELLVTSLWAPGFLLVSAIVISSWCWNFARRIAGLPKSSLSNLGISHVLALLIVLNCFWALYLNANFETSRSTLN
jgi:hypothetical protein